jgi:gas vesicle protein
MSKSGSKILLATAFGLAIGVGIGLLIAPAKGSRTRKKLKKMILDASESMQNNFSEKISELQSVFSGEKEESPQEDEFNNEETI